MFAKQTDIGWFLSSYIYYGLQCLSRKFHIFVHESNLVNRNLYMKRLIAICGLDCEKCDAYKMDARISTTPFLIQTI